MLKQERQKILLETLQREGKLLAGELSMRLNVSEDTIRRDLRDLTLAGKLQRVHGGALPHSPAEAPYAERLKMEPAAKANIARAALGLLRQKQVILMDGGTTTLLIARSLPADLRLTVVTNSIPVAAALSDNPAVEVIVLGGHLFHQAQVTIGAMTIETLQNIRPDLCLLGVCSLNPEAGLTVNDLEESYVKRAMIACSRQVAAPVTADKLNTASAYLVAPISAITTLITDSEIPSDLLDPYRQAGIAIIT